MSENYYVWVSFSKRSNPEALVAEFEKASTMEQKIAVARRLGQVTAASDSTVPPQLGPFLMSAKSTATARIPIGFAISKEFGKAGWADKELDCRVSPMSFPDAASADEWFKKYGAEELNIKHAIVYFLARITA